MAGSENPETGASRGIEILYAEEDPGERDRIRRLLEAHPGFRVRVAAFREALEKGLAAGPPDVVVSSFNLSGLAGAGILERVRRLEPDLPILFLGNQEGALAVVDLARHRGVDYLVKTPEHLVRLSAAVETLVCNRRAEQQRKQAEAALNRLATAVEQAWDSVEITDADAVIQYVNPAFERVTGYTRAELIGRNPRILQSGKHDTVFYRSLWRTLTQGRPWKGRFINRRKDGTLYEEEATITPVKDPDGTIIHYVAVKRDITSRARLERRLFQAQKMEALGTLAAGLGHEINNPLNAIMLNVPLLKAVYRDFLPVLETASGPEHTYGGLPLAFIKSNLEPLLTDMELAVQRIAAIVRRLKHFSRDSEFAEKRPMSLNDAVINAVRLSKTSIRKAGITLEQALAPDLLPIEGHPQSIEQVVLNLLLNSAQAIDHDRGRIRVSTERQGDQVLLRVADNGKGIDPRLEHRVYDPFVTDKQDQGGTGLGLAVTYRLVESHGGEIDFESRPGRGTVFTVRFSVTERPPLPLVMLVDDDEAFLSLLSRALNQKGRCLVETVSKGTEALIKMGTRRPELLVLDIFMPEMNGVDVCRAIQAEDGFQDMRVIIVTGHPEHPAVEHVKAMGYNRIYGKPLELSGFVDDLLALLEGGETRHPGDPEHGPDS